MQTGPTRATSRVLHTAAQEFGHRWCKDLLGIWSSRVTNLRIYREDLGISDKRKELPRICTVLGLRLQLNCKQGFHPKLCLFVVFEYHP